MKMQGRRRGEGVGGLISIGQPFLYLFRTRKQAVLVSNSRHSFFMRLPREEEKREGGEGGGKGSGFPVVRRQFDGAASFRPLFQGRTSFLAAGQGETKDKLQRRPSCDPSHLTPYIYIHTESCTDYGRKFLAGPSPQQASLFSSIYKTFLSSISIFSTKLLYYQLFLPSYLSRERNRKSWKPVWLPSKKIVCPSFRNIEIAVKRRPTAR